MHFMDLELKILKEKVVEDEKNTGIGSLFNDEKNSHQHISLLKEKYAKMRKDYNQQKDDMEKEKLRVLGDQFVLDSQINIMTDLNNRMEEVAESAKINNIKDLKIEEHKLKQRRIELENFMESLGRDLGESTKDNYEFNMQLTKEEEADNVTIERFTKAKEADEVLIEQKKGEIGTLETQLAEIMAKFEQNKDYQDNRQIAEDFREKIEVSYVDLNILNAKVMELEAAREMYDRIKEDELEEKKRLEEVFGDISKDLQAKEQLNKMRVQKRMNDTRNPEIKELMLNQEIASDNITEF